MKQYRVTWGEEVSVVNACDEAEAWSNFAAGNKLATSHPKMNERKVELIEPAPEPEKKPKK